jgi:hypothetical protein
VAQGFRRSQWFAWAYQKVYHFLSSLANMDFMVERWYMNNEDTEVIIPLPNSVDAEIRAGHRKLDQKFDEFWTEEDSKKPSAVMPDVREPEPVAQP